MYVAYSPRLEELRAELRAYFAGLLRCVGHGPLLPLIDETIPIAL